MSQFSHESAYEEACRTGVLPGAVLVAADATGKFHYAKAFGETARGEKLALDSVMWMASCTKLMTAVAALQQVEQGKIGLDDDVANLLPELAAAEVLDSFDSEGKPVLKKREEKITLRYVSSNISLKQVESGENQTNLNSRLLLSHASGSGYPWLDPNLQKLVASSPPSTKPIRTIVEDFAQPLVFQPGHGWSYGPGLDWAGQIVERLTGLKLGEYMRANIWKPLGMKHMSFNPDESPELKERKIGLSIRGEDGRLAHTTEGILYLYTDRDDHYGGSGAWGSAESFLPILQTLCANDGRILSPALVDELFRPQLGAESKAMLNHTVKNIDILRRVFGNAFDVDYQDFNHGLGGNIGLKDEDGGRAAGTMSWGGTPNLIWWVDRKTGLCGACFTQLLPVGDVNGNNLMRVFEKAVYKRYQEFSGNI